MTRFDGLSPLADPPAETKSKPEKFYMLNEINIHTPFQDLVEETGYKPVNSINTERINVNDTEADQAEFESSEVKSSGLQPCEGLMCWAKLTLNKELGLNLTVNNLLDEPAKKAIEEFQRKNNIPVTQKIDAATERSLLEADALARSKGIITLPAALSIIAAAKIKIEDWTKHAVDDKPEITNTYRDPRRLWAFVLHQMAFKRKNRQTKKLSDPNSYLRTGAHFCIFLDGRIVQLHRFSRMIWHAQCISPRSVGVEFEGNFPNVKGKWWKPKDSKYHDKDIPTQAQFESGKFLTRYLKIVLGTTHVLAHRQSSDSRENDPGPDIWYNVGQWAIDNLGMTDGGSSFKCGTGKPILPEWRTWRNKTNESVIKEYNEAMFQPDQEEEEFDFSEDLYRETGDEPDHQHYSANIENLVQDWSRAVSLNRYYADKLGWNQFHNQINNLLLPHSGLQNVSLGEEAFAQAVAAWQAKQGFSAKDCDGIIGPITWSRLKPLLNQPSYYPQPKAPVLSQEPSAQNIFEFNRWHAEKILDAMNSGIVGSNFNSKDQLENIVKGIQVFNVNPNTRIIQALPIISHVTKNAESENYRDIIIGSFIRVPDSTGKCTGHCEGRCIDFNIKSGSFESSDSTQMVIKILQYLKDLPEKYKKSFGFGMPLQGDFFGRQNLQKFKSVDPSALINPDLRKLVFDLGYVFPDNNNHLHIQVKWETVESQVKHEDLLLSLEDKEIADDQPYEHLFTPLLENYSLAHRLDKVRDWLYLLIFKVSDELVSKLRERSMYVQYAHNESYSNDLNTDFYRLRINKYPLLNGVQMNSQSLIKYIRLNINNLVDTSYCDFYPYNYLDVPLWSSDDPAGAVLKLDIKGPDNASVVVSLSKPNGWRFTTVHTPATGDHPVSGHREFFIGKDSSTGGTYFVIKGLDMMSSGIAGLGLPFGGSYGFGQAHALWKSMRSKIIQFINANGGEAKEDITYSERVDWRFVYYRYKNLLEQTFGKGAGSAANSPFFDFLETQSYVIYKNVN